MYVAALQEQTLRVYDGGSRVVLSKSHTNRNIPFADAFTIKTIHSIAAAGSRQHSCVYTVHLWVDFSKFCFVRSVIDRTTTKDLAAFYQSFADAALSVLQEEGSSGQCAAVAGAVTAPTAVAASADGLSTTPLTKQRLLLVLLFVLHCYVILEFQMARNQQSLPSVAALAMKAFHN